MRYQALITAAAENLKRERKDEMVMAAFERFLHAGSPKRGQKFPAYLKAIGIKEEGDAATREQIKAQKTRAMDRASEIRAKHAQWRKQ